MFKLWSKSCPGVSKFCSELVLALREISSPGRRRSRRRRERNGARGNFDSAWCQTQQLEARCLLDGSFVLQEIGATALRIEDPPIFQKPVITQTGNAYFVEYADIEVRDKVNIRTTLPAVSEVSVPSTLTIVPDIEYLKDFDANGRGQVAFIHSPPVNVGTVTTITDGPRDYGYLMIDVQRPIAYANSLSFPTPSLGASAFLFRVTFADAGSFLNLERQSDGQQRFNGEELKLNGPNGQIELSPYRIESWWGDRVIVDYAAASSDGTWEPSDNGKYTLTTIEGGVTDVAGNAIEHTRLAEFEIDWDDNAEYSRFEVEIPDYSVEHNFREGHDFVRDNRFTFASRADFSQLVDDNVAGYNIRLDHVSLSESGIVAVAGELDDHPMIVRWDSSSKTANGTLLNVELEGINAIDVADAGSVAISAGYQILHLPAGGNVPTPITRLPYAQVFVRISPDGAQVLFNGAPNVAGQAGYGVLVYDTNRAVINRIVGQTGDQILDPGERWEYLAGGQRRDVSANFIEVSYAVDIAQSPTGIYWVLYGSLSAWESQPGQSSASSRIFARSLKHKETGELMLGSPLLLGAIHTNPVNPDGTPTYPGTDVASTFNPSTGEFHSLLTWTPNQSVPIVRRFRSRGKLPEYNPNYWSDETTRHANLEIMAREIAYAELRDPARKYQVGTVLENGYVIEGMYLDDTAAGGGFAAVSFLPFESNGNGTPIFAFRGTDADLAESTNLGWKGVGYSQFNKTRQWVDSWMSTHDVLFAAGTTLTGHSLGGALSQWFAAWMVAGANHRLSEVVTFNSPGISSDFASQVSDVSSSQISNGITHYIVSGDFVSLAGVAFIHGTVRLMHIKDSVGIVLDVDLWGSSKVAARHTRPILNETIGTNTKKLPITWVQEFTNTKVLNHPEFNFLGDPAYVEFLQGFSMLFGSLSQVLVSRQRVELLRKVFGLTGGLPLGLPASAPVFVSLDVARAIAGSTNSVSDYDFFTKTLVVDAFAPLIAVGPSATFPLLQPKIHVSGIQGNSRSEIFDARGRRPVSIANPGRPPGDYVVYMRNFRWLLDVRSEVANVRVVGPGTRSAGTLGWQTKAKDSSYEVWIDNLTTGQKQQVRASGISASRFDLPEMEDGEYRYWIQREDSIGGGPWSRPIEFAVVNGNAVLPPSSGELTWTSWRNASSYEVWIDNRTARKSAFLIESGLVDSRLLLPALPDGEYDYWIQFEDADGNGPWSGRQSFRVVDGHLANAISESSGSITWQPRSSAMTYELWINDLTNGKQKVVHAERIPFSRFELPQLPDGEYRYWIQYEGADAKGSWSKPLDFTVANGKAELTGYSGVLSWSRFDTATSYELWIDNRTIGQQRVIHETAFTDTSFWLPELADGEYSYWIRIHTATGPLTWSSRIDFRITDSRLAPANLNSAGILSWTSHTDAANYEVWISPGNGSTTRIAGATRIPSATFELPQLTDGEYRYWIKRLDGAGQGTWDPARRFVIKDGQLQSATNELFLAWNPVSSADSYELWIDNRSTNQIRIVRFTHLEFSWAELPVLPDGNYEYWVRTKAKGVLAKWSSPRRFRIIDGQMQY